jgi:hypothetical protein
MIRLIMIVKICISLVAFFLRERERERERESERERERDHSSLILNNN